MTLFGHPDWLVSFQNRTPGSLPAALKVRPPRPRRQPARPLPRRWLACLAPPRAGWARSQGRLHRCMRRLHCCAAAAAALSARPPRGPRAPPRPRLQQHYAFINGCVREPLLGAALLSALGAAADDLAHRMREHQVEWRFGALEALRHAAVTEPQRMRVLARAWDEHDVHVADLAKRLAVSGDAARERTVGCRAAPRDE